MSGNKCKDYHNYGDWHKNDEGVSVRKCLDCGSIHAWSGVKSTTRQNSKMMPGEALYLLKEMVELGYILWDEDGIITWNPEYQDENAS